jgi:cell division protein FtsQ
VSVAVDPRLEDRRRQVKEGWARRRLRWLIVLVGVIVVVGVGLALLQSPWLAVRSVTVFGAERADVVSLLATYDVAEGEPTISIRAGVVEAALAGDPWVSRAEVRVTWPGTVEVTVLERTPSGWIESSAGWVMVATDGVVLETGAPTGDAAIVSAPVDALAPGDRIDDPEVVGAFEFLGLLPDEYAAAAVGFVGPSGIEAIVSGHRVLLGNRRDMPDKVATLVAMLDEPLEPEVTLNVISPTRPGVINPRPLVEETEEDVSSSDVSG